MPLRFLVPLFLLGLAALAVPILVHLTRRQKAKVVEFPSLMFLEQVPFRSDDRRRIHHWLLLLLRALVVALIVAAFARPFMDDAETAAALGSGPREVVILVDRSFSMGVEDRWSRGVEEARRVVRDLGPLDRASIVVFARNAQVVVRSTTDRSRLLGALDTLKVGDESTNYGPGLKLAQTILEETDLPSRELVLVGDFQRAGWSGEEGVSLPAGTAVTPVFLGGELQDNRAVVDVSLPRQRLAGRDRITPAARLVRVGGSAPDTVDVIFELEGRELQRRTVGLPANGAATVTFDPFNLSQEHTRGAVRIADADALAPDDVLFFVISPGRAVEVLILDAAGRGAASSLFLREALAISEEGEFSVTVQAPGQLSPANLEGVSVVVLNDRPVASGNETEALRSFVEGGGGLVVVTGERFRWPPELADLLPGSPTQATDRANGRGGRLGHLEYDHPVFEIFRGPRSGDFTGARFFRSRALEGLNSAGGRILARFDDGSVALAEKLVGEGRVLIWTSTLDAFWNDLVQQPVFLPFAHQLVRYASGKRESVTAFTAGQILDVSDAEAMATAGLGEVSDALVGREERVAVTPSGEALPLPVGEGPHFLSLVEQGIYEIRPPGASSVRSLSMAVNVDPAEADLAPLDVEEVTASISARAGDGESVRSEGPRASRLRLEDQERRQSLWRTLLMVAFVLLALETLVSNRISSPGGRKGSYAGP